MLFNVDYKHNTGYAFYLLIVSAENLLQWLRGLGLSELQCSEPGLLVRQGVGSSPTPASMSSQVSACYEIKFSGRHRGFACVLF